MGTIGGFESAAFAARPPPEKKEPYIGPRGNISQGGGAFLNHPNNVTDLRKVHIPKFAGHRPYQNVVPRGGRLGYGSFHFDKPPLTKGRTYITPGYAGFVRGAQDTIQQSANLHPSPSQEWIDDRVSAEYDKLRDYKAEVGGLVPGYRGHVPGGMRNIGVSSFGGLSTWQGFPTHLKWAQSRHDAAHERAQAFARSAFLSSAAAGALEAAAAAQAPAPPPPPPPADDFLARLEAATSGLFDKKPSMQRPASAEALPSQIDRHSLAFTEAKMRRATVGAAIDLHAEGIEERSGGMVPPHAAIAAAKAARRGAALMAEHASKVNAEKKLQEYRMALKSGIVEQGVTPGYKGHVPRHRDNVGVSPYRGRGADSKNLIGRVPSKSAIKPPSRPQSARGARKGEVVVL